MSREQKIKVTCSILCYNYGRFLSQAIESCLNQEAGNYELEILVIDDGSTDETPEVCARYREHIRISRSQNRGFGPSIDRAITEATGDYVCLLDADDYFATNKIVSLLPCMERQSLYIDHVKYVVNEQGDSLQSEPGEAGNTSTICVQRRAALTLLPTLNEIFFHPLFMAGQGTRLPQQLSYYRIHNSSMLNAQKREAWLRHHAQVTHTLANSLRAKSRQKNASCFWASRFTLRRLSHLYRTIAFYDETSAALLNRNRAVARRGSLRLLFHLCLSGNLRSNMWKTAIRGLLMMPDKSS